MNRISKQMTWLRFSNAKLIRHTFDTSNILAALKVMTLVSLLVTAMAASSAAAVKPAVFGMQFTCPSDGLPDEYGDGIVVRYNPGQLNIDRQWFGGFDAHGSLTTNGGAMPSASLSMQLVGSGEQGVNLRVKAIASILYYFQIVPAIGEWTGTVRVRITRSGSITTNSNAALNIGPDTKVGVKLYHGPIDVIGLADMSGQIGHKEFSHSTKYTISPNIEYFLNLYALGDLNVFTGETTTISGWVDPIIEIDPDWLAAHPEAPPLNIEYSSGFGPQVPEPSNLLALGLPVLMLGLRKLRRL